MFRRLLVTTVGVSAVCAAPVAGQDWMDVTSFRHRSGEERLEVQVRYGAGRLLVGSGASAGELYRVGMRYDPDVFEPITDYRSGVLRVGVEGVGSSIRMAKDGAGELDLRLSPDLPLDLDLDFGAVEADIELGGLQVRELDIETGASETQVRFSTPNAVSCDRMGLSMGAASFTAEGLGNANCAEINVEGGVGEVTLDFSGDWRRDMDADIAMALGSLTLVIPSTVGVRVEKDTFLTSFDDARFEKRDGVYYSTNWDSAQHRLDVDLSGAFGSVNIRWRN